MESIDTVVIGAGVVGLAAARAYARAGHETLVIERASAIGTGTSSRNSEVIHAGLYYPAGSAKARLCVNGREQLYEFAASHQVGHRRCGKLLVACDEADGLALERIAGHAAAAGVGDLRMLSAAQVLALEPAVRCQRALLSPSTGIIDSHGLMLALLGDFTDAGGMLAYAAPLEAWHRQPDGLVLEVGGREPMRLKARRVVNAAGHDAPRLLARLEGYPAELRIAQFFAKGSYFSLSGRPPFSRLVYPAPGAASLGVHATLDLAGRTRFGPDIEWVEDETDLDVDPARADSFYAAIRRYWPELPDDSLIADYAGIRPKIHPPGTPMPDFCIDLPDRHGIEGLVNLLGIESPGLTASLALADELVAAL